MQKRKKLMKTTLAVALSGVLTFTASPTQATLGNQMLQKGMTHSDVQVLQEELKNLGYMDIKNTTTYYGEETAQSIRAFQIAENLEINGTFDQNTYNALQNKKNGNTTQVVASNTETNSASQLAFSRTLSLGDRGEDVKQLQEALKATGYLSIDNTTNYFGNQTKTALIAFQSDNDFVPDGIAGLRTIEGINKVLTGRGITLPQVTRGSESRDKGAEIVATGKKYLGVPYSFGGTSPRGFDCSGFTSYVYKQHGISIPRTTGGQASAGTKVDKANLQIGDLLIFSNTYKAGPSHAGIYIGDGKFVHASSTRSGGVIISDLNSNYYTNHFSYGRRVL